MDDNFDPEARLEKAKRDVRSDLNEQKTYLGVTWKKWVWVALIVGTLVGLAVASQLFGA